MVQIIKTMKNILLISYSKMLICHSPFCGTHNVTPNTINPDYSLAMHAKYDFVTNIAETIPVCSSAIKNIITLFIYSTLVHHQIMQLAFRMVS